MASVGRKTFSEINITPLTDIFLVLLIIMMVVAPMLDSSGLKLAVPSAGPSPDQKEQPKTINVSLTAQDAVEIDGQAVPMADLSRRLRTMAFEKPDGVLITADPQASHSILTAAMDAAQSAGISKLAVVGGGADPR